MTKSMNVFISYDSRDSQLAYQLKQFLKEKDIEGYVFDTIPTYDKTLHTKITAAINNSVALIAIITNNNKSTSVHEEIGYAIAKEKSVIIMTENDAVDGVLSHEREKEMFTRDDFESSCKRIHVYLTTFVKDKIIQEGSKPKPSNEEVEYVQKSAHFRYEIKQCLDNVLDLVVYRLQIVPEKRDWIHGNIEKRKILFEEIFEIFNHNFSNGLVKKMPPIETKLLQFPLTAFHRFNNEFESFRMDVKRANELPHNDLLSNEQDAYQKFNQAMSNIDQNSFDIKNYAKQYYEDENALVNCDNFLQIMEAFPNDVPTPLTSIFKGKMRDLATIVKSILLLEKEIDRIYDDFGEISLKHRFID